MINFDKIKDDALARFIPVVRDETLKKMIDICEKMKPKMILEIGTAIGYSGMALLENSDAKLITIEKNEDRYHEACQNFQQNNLESRVKPFLGDAIYILKELSENNYKFDLIFLDGPKGQYIRYFKFLKQMLNKGGVLFADNVYLHGFVQNDEVIPHKRRAMVRNLRTFIETLKNDNDFETNFYDIDDGFSISILK